MILAAFAAATFVGRLVIPWIGRHTNETKMRRSRWPAPALSISRSPFLTSATALGALSFVLGLALGSGQPVVLSLLHANGRPGASARLSACACR